MNNYFIKKILNILIKDEIENKKDNDLTLLSKKARTLLNKNDQISLNYENNLINYFYNYIYEQKYKISKFSIEKNKFINNNINNNSKDIKKFNLKENIINDKTLDNYNKISKLNKNILINNNIKSNINSSSLEISKSKNQNLEDLIDNEKCFLKLNENINEQITNKNLINSNKFLKKKRK